jgi:hypothetical protein
MEHLVQLAVPIIDEPSWHNHQRAGQLPAGEFAQDEAVYGLPRPTSSAIRKRRAAAWHAMG